MSAPHRIEQQLSAYLDGELLPRDAEEVRRHLAECPGCRAELTDLEAAKRLLGRLQAPALPPSFSADLWARLNRRRGRIWISWPRPAMALAGVALIIILVAVPAMRDQRNRLRAAEHGPDLFMRDAVQLTAQDPFVDRAYLGLVQSDANLRLAGEDPRGALR